MIKDKATLDKLEKHGCCWFLLFKISNFWSTPGKKQFCASQEKKKLGNWLVVLCWSNREKLRSLVVKSLSQNRFKKLQLEHVVFKRVFFSPTTKKRWRFFGKKFNFLFKQIDTKKKNPKTYNDFKSLFITVQKYSLVFNVYLKIHVEHPP